MSAKYIPITVHDRIHTDSASVPDQRGREPLMLQVALAWRDRLLMVGLKTVDDVAAMSDEHLAHKLGVPLGVVTEVRHAVDILHAEHERAVAEQARQAVLREERKREAEERRKQKAAEDAVKAEAARVERQRQLEVDAERARQAVIAAEAQRQQEAAQRAAARVTAALQARARMVAFAEAQRARTAAEAAAHADAVAKLRSNPLRFDHPWPPGPSQIDNIGLSEPVHRDLRLAGWFVLAVLRDADDDEIWRKTRTINRKGMHELRAVIGYSVLKSLGLSVRAYNALKNDNLTTIEAIDETPDHVLLRIPNFGRKSLREVRAAIAATRAKSDTEDLEALIAAELDRRDATWMAHNALHQRRHSWPERARP